MSFVVLPEFHVAADKLEAFLASAQADAEASVANEPDCLQFEVFVDQGEDVARVMFYEVYTDRVAFDAHLETPHLAEFNEALALCDEQPVRFFERVVS